MSLDPRELRNAFGSFMTGVTVITTVDGEGRPTGFTANSFTSVSLEPPLLMVCLGKTAICYEQFMQTDRFAVNILSARPTRAKPSGAPFWRPGMVTLTAPRPLLSLSMVPLRAVTLYCVPLLPL